MLRNCLTKMCKSFNSYANGVVLHADVSCVPIFIYSIILRLYKFLWILINQLSKPCDNLQGNLPSGADYFGMS